GLRAALVIVLGLQALVGARLTAGQVRGVRLLAAAIIVAGVLWARPPRLYAPPGDGTLVAQHVVGHEDEYRVLCYHESAIATTEVIEHRSGHRELVIDGFVAAGTVRAANYMALMGRLPMMLHPHAARALVICFGTGQTARAVADAA